MSTNILLPNACYVAKPKVRGSGKYIPCKTERKWNEYMCVCVCVCVCVRVCVFCPIYMCVYIFIYIYIYHYLSEVINNPKTEGIKATFGERLLQEQL